MEIKNVVSYMIIIFTVVILIGYYNFEIMSIKIEKEKSLKLQKNEEEMEEIFSQIKENNLENIVIKKEKESDDTIFVYYNEKFITKYNKEIQLENLKNEFKNKKGVKEINSKIIFWNKKIYNEKEIIYGEIIAKREFYSKLIYKTKKNIFAQIIFFLIILITIFYHNKKQKKIIMDIELA